MEIIILENFPSLNLLDESALADDVNAAATEIEVLNASGFSTNNAILIGRPGREQSEIKTPSAISANDITLTGALSFDHEKDGIVYVLRATQLRIYRAANVDGTRPASAAFSLLATVNIEADRIETEYIDAGGGRDYWYTYTFYNSLDSSETNLDPAQAVRGGGYGFYSTLDSIRYTAGFDGASFLADDKIADAREDANAIIKGQIKKKYTLPLSSTPKALKRIEQLYAAGLLLSDEFGIGGADTTQEGNQKIRLAKELLKGVVSGEIGLVDETDKALTSMTDSIDGSPFGDVDQPGPHFTIDQEF